MGEEDHMFRMDLLDALSDRELDQVERYPRCRWHRLSDLNGKSKKVTKGTIYKGGHAYQHPTDKTLIRQAKGQKPRWLRGLEGDGGFAVALPCPRIHSGAQSRQLRLVASCWVAKGPNIIW